MRIQRDAMSTDSGARIKRHIAERFRCGTFNHFPDINIKLLAHQCNLINETDIDRAEGILEQLDHLRRLGG